MRLLVYVEPHPIRDAATHFVDVARRFLPLLAARGGLDVRMFANAATLDLLGDAGRPVAARLIRTTAVEEEVLAGHLVPWEERGIAVWRDLMAGRGEVTEDHLRLLRRVWSRFPFDAIVHWGENGAVARFAAERGLLRIAMELGCTRSPFMESLVADPFGTNGAAVVPRLSVAELRDVVDGCPMSAGEALHAYVRTADGGLAARRFAPLPGTLAERLSRTGRIAFLPLQLFDDANLLRFSPFDTVADVVLHAVPPLVEAGYTVLVKPHPASARRPGSVAANEVARARLAPWAAGVVWCEPEVADDNARLIELADLVVTVNSSVGFEALYFDKPVVVLGDAVYKPRDLFPTLDAVLGGGFDPVAYRDGAGYLRRFLLGGYLQAPTLTSDGGAFERVAAALAPIPRGGTGDPFAVARSLWQVGAGPGRNRAEARIRAGIPEFSHSPGSGRDAVRSTPRDAASLADYDGALVDWMPVARRLLHHAGSTDLSGFAAWLDARLADAAAGVPEIVRIGAIVDPGAYLDVQIDVRDGRMDPFGHYVRHGFREARQLRRGMPRLLPDAIRGLILRAAALALAGVRMPEEPLPPDEAEHRRRSLGAIAAGLSGGAARIAVVAHLADRDLAPELLVSLRAIPEPFDLVVTLPDWGGRGRSVPGSPRLGRWPWCTTPPTAAATSVPSSTCCRCCSRAATTPC